MSTPTPRSSIFEINPYVGGTSKAKGVTNSIKLSANENPLGPSPKAIEAVKNSAGLLHRYPDGNALALREAIAETYSLPANQLVCGAGSDELIGLLIQSYANPGDEVIHTQHGFLMYRIYALACGAVPVVAPETNLTSDVDAILGAVSAKTKLVFIANPNNPTGTYIPKSELLRLREGLPDHVLLVIDGAYAEYVDQDDYSDGSDLVASHNNVVMTRTFSKIYGLAALRLGWCYAPEAIIDVLNRVRGPFNVSSAAIDAGIAAVNDTAYTQFLKEHNSQWLAWLNDALTEMGYNVVPSYGNFLLVKPQGNAEAIIEALKERGIFVRGVGSYGLADYIRITVGSEPENHALINTLKEIG